MQQRRGDPIGVTRWTLWALPRRALFVVVLVDLLAAGSLVVGFADRIATQPRPWPLTLAVLAVAGIVSTEASLGVERMRRQSEEAPNIDLSSVWAFAAAALLPGPLAAVVVLLSYGYMYLRLWRPDGIPMHRVLFNTATVVLAVQAAAPVVALGGGPTPFRSVMGLAALAAGVAAYAAVNMSLVVAVIVLSGPSPSLAAIRQLLGRGDDAVLEFATLSMGALTAGAVAEFGPAYAVLVLPPLIILHRAVLVRQLQEEARFDSKTGLLNAAAWDVEAERAVRRIEQLDGNVTVLVLDLDNFKRVNDEHGHLAGDQALVAVAEAIRDVVRDHDDLVGRFGGEEFVVLLPAPDGDPGRVAAAAVADRIRRRIEELRIEVATSFGDAVVNDLSVSIGGATSPVDGTRLADLVKVADAAMYAAKEAGRNRVCMGLRSVQPTAGDPEPEGSRSGNDTRTGGL
jgi:diguanylate cyclase (GGDEF)-like protein